MYSTQITFLEAFRNNLLYIKRDDLLPFSFGGNKARKVKLFFADISHKKADYVLTYGSRNSNHCRVVANMAAAKGLPCRIISPEVGDGASLNAKCMKLFGTEIITCPVEQISKTIDNQLEDLSRQGYHPYFIQGGGHGNIGTQAYVNCFDEITLYEKRYGVRFDYIFLASGTGTTQAGLVCGKLLHHRNVEIVGISIARPNPRGEDAVRDSVSEYMAARGQSGNYADTVNFVDSYTCGGYGKYNDAVENTVKNMMRLYGIPLSTTYTGKAFWGMQEYICNNQIENKKILFIHTGGVPLFLDDLENLI